MIYLFEGHSLDPDRRELRRGDAVVPVEPQVFDLLQYLIRQRGRVVSKDDLLNEIWNGRIVSESTLSSRITAVRRAVGDSGAAQRLIRTVARKGLRFVATVREVVRPDDDGADATPHPLERAAAVPTGPLPAERRQVTILSCEMVGAMALSSQLDPEDFRETVAAHRDCVEAIVERYGGFVARSIGDGVLGCFGYPRAHEDDAERAVQAGLAVIQAVCALDIGCCAEALQSRVGIATGVVVVDALTDADPGARLAVVGETPLLAARLLALADPGAVVVSATTRRLIGRLYEYRDLEPLGSSAATASSGAAQVLRESALADRFEALRPRRARLIGREEELAMLQRRWTRARTGEGSVVLICGEAGIGKSHLAAALQDTLQPDRQACLRYFCSPHRTQTALYPVIAQLEHAAGFELADDDATKLDKLERLLASSADDDARGVALFAELLSISKADRFTPSSISAQRRKELLLECFIAHLARLAARQPVLVVLEDAHWVDPTTAELFDVVVDRIETMPVLLVITYRPGFTAPWVGRSHVTSLTLNRLRRHDNAALVRQVAGGREFPGGLLEQIVRQTDGVPLFIEEVTKAVLESGVLHQEGGAYVLSGHQPVMAVPATLQASLAARLDRLAPVRALVQTCAALGREFSYSVLKAVTALSDAELEPLLSQLVQSELVHRRGTLPHATFIFKHALVQDAAYGTMVRNQRSRLHARIVEVYEHELADHVARHPDVLAYHCTEAGLWEKAIDSWIRAARMALDRSAGIEAQAQVEAALGLLANVAVGSIRDQLEGRLQVALGDALVMTQGFASPDVMAALSRGRELLEGSVHPVETLRALCGLFNYHMIRSESPQCLALAEPFLQRDLTPPAATVAHYLVGAAHLHLGNFRQSVEHLEAALSLYDDEKCRSVAFIAGYHLRSFTLIWLGLGYLYLGSMNRAAQTMSVAVDDARRRSHPFTLVSALLALARFRNHTHDLAGASEATEEGMAIASEQRSPYHLSRGSILRAVNIVDSGRPEEGIALMQHALAAHCATGANFQSSYNLSRLAEAHAHAGRTELALELAGRAEAEIERSGERWWESEARRIRGEILLKAVPARRAEAAVCFERALDCARHQQAKLWELHAAQSLAELWATEGRQRHARDLLGPIYVSFSEGQDTANLQHARKTLEKLGWHC